MAVSLDDVRHIASLARLGVSDDRAHLLAVELNTILEHMQVLSQVDTSGIDEIVPAGTAVLPLRADAGPPALLERPLEVWGSAVRDGFFLVPRLATHDAEPTP